VVEEPATLRLPSDYVFDSVGCHDGLIWEPACGPEFTVTLTVTEVVDELAATVTPGVVGDYEISVEGGPFTALTSTVTIADAAPVTVTIREAGGLQRSVTLTDVDPDAAPDTAFGFQSEQTTNDPKTVTEGVNHPSGSPFVIVGGYACTLMTEPDPEQRARDALATVEQRLVEERYWTVQLANASPTLPVGATAQPLSTAIAVLEEYARAQSGYVGVLHSSPFLAPFAAKRRLIAETHPEMVKRTPLWTPWAFGGGYLRTGPAGQGAPAAGQAWIYLTGPITVHRGPVSVPGKGIGGFDQFSNQNFVIAERSYVVINDCPVAAVLADVTVEETS